MKYIIIKFFPSAKIDYVSHYFFNFLFSLIFIINIPFLDNLLFFRDKPVYTLLIPFTEESYEENKDQIFSRLSINDRIISVKKIEKKVILEKLSKKIEPELILEDFIPEAFEIVIKKNNYLDINKENKNIKEIIKGAEIIAKTTMNKKTKLLSFFSLFISTIFFMTLLFILQINYIKKIKPFLIKSRIYGGRDKDIIFNVSSGYFLFQALGVLSSYFLIYILETEYKILNFSIMSNIGTIIIFVLIQNIICTLILGYYLKSQLRKVL
ncbi:MAG: hypothetical protein CBC53_004015 [Alphaproteobacteria bacterium TMED93]|nr:MAG: hypothetical protein CBC53_004015 [Alphaproteobacteria bacterium TMED93]